MSIELQFPDLLLIENVIHFYELFSASVRLFCFICRVFSMKKSRFLVFCSLNICIIQGILRFTLLICIANNCFEMNIWIFSFSQSFERNRLIDPIHISQCSFSFTYCISLHEYSSYSICALLYNDWNGWMNGMNIEEIRTLLLSSFYEYFFFIHCFFI